MEPKFQSSFIPKGPVSVSHEQLANKPKKKGDLLSTLSATLFVISVLFAIGTFGYNFWLDYSIRNMDAELDRIRATISPETVEEIIRLDNRLISTKELLDKHIALSPVFEFLESSTPSSVRFNGLEYSLTDKGHEIRLFGEATSYASLALESDVINRSDDFRNTVFSDLNLNQQGNVAFSLSAVLGPEILSYDRVAESSYLPLGSEEEVAEGSTELVPEEAN